MDIFAEFEEEEGEEGEIKFEFGDRGGTCNDGGFGGCGLSLFAGCALGEDAGGFGGTVVGRGGLIGDGCC